MSNIGVIGSFDSICGFGAVGFDIFAVQTTQQAREQLKCMADNDYGVIFITEPFMEKLLQDCAQYDDQPTPCIIPIPANTGITGLGEARLRQCVERAIGSDVIFNG